MANENIPYSNRADVDSQKYEANQVAKREDVASRVVQAREQQREVRSRQVCMRALPYNIRR